MRLSILVPAYHEERTIGEVLRHLVELDSSHLGAELELIVCDDGSRDRTAAEVHRAQLEWPQIRLVSHLRNRGKGRAIRTALQSATGDYVLIQDADLEYDMSAYPFMIAAANAGALAVYGSRFLARAYPTGMAPANFLANKLLTGMTNWLFRSRITDEATCLKLVRTDVLRSLRLTCERFEFCAEVTAKLGLLGIPIVEVPVDYRARSAEGGKRSDGPTVSMQCACSCGTGCLAHPR